MPSVGMRRSTRVFVPKSVVKDADEARVLRSGKRLWSESVDGKPGRGSDGDEWFRLLNHPGDAEDVSCCKENGWHNDLQGKEVAVMDLNGESALLESLNNSPGVSTANESVDRSYGIVYHRKRRGVTVNRSLSSSFPSEVRVFEDRKYGIPFVRKQRRKSSRRIVCQVLAGNLAPEVGFLRHDLSLGGFACHAMLVVVIKSSCNSSYRFSCFLNSILSYMMRTRVKLSQLTAFMCSKPISLVFSRNGIRFLRDFSYGNTQENDVALSGICKIFGARRLTPLFSLDFLAVPFSFMYWHCSMLLRSSFLPDVLVRYLMGLYTEAHRLSDNHKCLSCIPSELDHFKDKVATSGNTSIKRRKADLVVRAPKSGRSASSRYTVNSHSTRKRSSLRLARATNHSIADLDKSYNGMGADILSIGDDCAASNCKRRKSIGNDLGENMKELKATLVELRQNMDSLSCTANILVIESHKCYREEGAEVVLECSASNEWLIAVKMHGSLRYCHKAQNSMRQSPSNRFTHAMIWMGGNSWKLEFPDRREWLIFKELHRECYDRNVQVAPVRIIPVPGVREVQGLEDSICTPFVRPEAYITMSEDEVARALMKTTANYDIQSDDEELLNKLNDGEKCGTGHISADEFEKIIDVLEKAAYCSLDDVSDENIAINLCLHLGRREIVAATYNYWLKKRKRKRSALVKVFQDHPPMRAQLVQKPFLRKKRSFKRKRRQYGRGKQPGVLEGMATEHDAMAAMHRVEEAKASAKRSLEVATFKRRRAQILMENADLETYKATIALKIAESAQRPESQDATASFFLG